MTDRIIDEAIAWHSAQQQDDCDWDAFALWLESDPRHRDEFDAIALIDDSFDTHRVTLQSVLMPLVVAAPTPSRRRWLVGAAGGMAAALALVAGLPIWTAGSPASVDYRTAPGESRMIALTDGSRIHLASASHLAVAGDRQDRITLEGGAYFDIRHDPARTMTIRAGDQQITDIGTRFDILASGGAMRIAVSQGRVSVSSPALASAVQLGEGRQLIVDPARHLAEVEGVQAANVGAWRQGRLVMDNMPLSLVAAEISRYAGRHVNVASGIAGRRFSGVLVVGDGSALVGEVARIMDLRVVPDGDGILLAAGRP